MPYGTTAGFPAKGVKLALIGPNIALRGPNIALRVPTLAESFDLMDA